MSSDTAKENASVVDSSVTEWKHYMGDFDNQGNKLLVLLHNFMHTVTCCIMKLTFHYNECTVIVL